MIFKTQRMIIGSLLALLLPQACAKQTAPVVQDAEKIQHAICSLATVDDVSRQLSAMGVQSFLNEKERALNAIQRKDASGLVTSSVAITVQYAADRQIKSCRVRVVHTGP